MQLRTVNNAVIAVLLYDRAEAKFGILSSILKMEGFSYMCTGVCSGYFCMEHYGIMGVGLGLFTLVSTVSVRGGCLSSGCRAATRSASLREKVE